MLTGRSFICPITNNSNRFRRCLTFERILPLGQPKALPNASTSSNKHRLLMRTYIYAHIFTILSARNNKHMYTRGTGSVLTRKLCTHDFSQWMTEDQRLGSKKTRNEDNVSYCTCNKGIMIFNIMHTINKTERRPACRRWRRLQYTFVSLWEDRLVTCCMCGYVQCTIQDNINVCHHGQQIIGYHNQQCCDSMSY